MTALAQPVTRRGAGLQPVAVAAAGAVGVVVIGHAFGLARANHELDTARLLLWFGLALIAVPAFAVLIRDTPARTVRVLVLVLFGTFLYVAKVLYAPRGLTFPDEFFHFSNAQHIVATGKLYARDPLLPVSSNYPGLAAVTAAMSQASGLSLFASSLIVIGVARALLLIGLFLLFERLSASQRVAGLGAALFAANPNFLFWGAQFAYESLAFPLFVITLVMVTRSRADGHGGTSALWLAAITASGVVVTHHLTGLALAVVLWVLVLLDRRSGRKSGVSVALAVYVSAAVLLWLLVVASGTDAYLGDIFSKAYKSVSDAFGRQGSTRTPFQAAGFKTPIDDKLLGALSALLSIWFGGWGALTIWRRRGELSPLATLLGIAAALTVVAFGLRVFPEAWEIGNRASSYIFLGTAFGAALFFFNDRLGRRPLTRLSRGVLALGAAATVAGASVVGWPAAAQLPRPDTVKVGGGTIVSPTLAAGRWLCENTAPATSVVADENVSRFLLVHGFDHLLVGRQYPGSEFLYNPSLSSVGRDYIHNHQVRYVVLDQRKQSGDNVIGRFYRRPGADAAPGFYPASARTKYDNLPGARRVYDSGDIVIYRLGVDPLAGTRRCEAPA